MKEARSSLCSAIFLVALAALDLVIGGSLGVLALSFFLERNYDRVVYVQLSDELVGQYQHSLSPGAVEIYFSGPCRVGVITPQRRRLLYEMPSVFCSTISPGQYVSIENLGRLLADFPVYR